METEEGKKELGLGGIELFIYGGLRGEEPEFIGRCDFRKAKARWLFLRSAKSILKCIQESKMKGEPSIHPSEETGFLSAPGAE